ncbi:MAG: hypothetical protein A2493_01950 [Candidatus Magasanikbacteria bacterium RIFOXYC12_FULL_33_11]|uniref:O-antigen ligase-related domain-containing protein n=1 Tax=Candidatus Magasanikbacteria bacterium RIFOXYC12_FULL_33_11 TaxID=1798701 RepID=A0A1F6NMJ2_9BACT|nr:MAG: hypothetical protein A2493_01950 [Candidatus Magasanikbacteria bacterium RIFOXYC12_FULL_33_11]
MQKTLEKILKILIGVSFVIPLLVLPKMYIFPFIVPKIIYFRSLVLIMLGIYLILLLTNFQKYRPKFSWVNIAVLGFYISFAVSTFVGVDWYKSFWDNHERMLGLFTITHYVIYYFIITSVVRTWEDWKWLLRTFLLAGSVVMFIGLLQKYSDPNLLLNKGSDRVSSTLGNAIYFSGYGLFLFFIGIFLAVKENLRTKAIEIFSIEASWFWIEVFFSLLGLWGIFGGGTRGALVGFIAGGFILGLVYFFTLKEQKKLKQIVLLSFFGILVIFSVLFINRKTEFVAGLPAVGRLLATNISQNDTRVMAWGVAYDAWQEKPLLGWGPNNFYYAFNKYYNPQFLEYGFGETWFDNAHSVIMNTLAVQGIVGLLLYISIFVLVTIFLIKKYREGKVDVHILAFSLAFLWAHLVSISTVFENPTSYLYFFFFLAFANSFLVKDDSQNVKKNKAVSVPWSIFVFLVILLFIYSTDVNAARANKFTLKALQKVMEGQQSYEEDYKKALSIPSPHVDDIRNDTSRVFTDIISQVLKDSKVKNKWQIIEPLYNQAKDNLEENLKLHPNDIRVSLQLAQLKIYAAVASQNTQLLEESEAILKGTLELSPKRQQTQYMIAGVQENLHKYDEAVKILRESIYNDPKIANGWQQLESLYQAMGEDDMAKALHGEALEKGIKF